MADFGKLGEASVEIRAKLGKFEQDLKAAQSNTEKSAKKMQSSMDRFNKTIDDSIKGIFNWRNAMVAAAGAAGLLAITRQAIEFADAIGKTADRLGVSVEGLQELRFAAGRSGVEVATLETAIDKLSIKIGQAAAGNKLIAETFDQLGISIRNTDGSIRSTEDVLRDLADALSRMESPAERSAIAMRLLEEGGVKVINVLRNGSRGMDEMAATARRLGLVLSEDVVRRAEQAADQLGDMTQVLKVGAANIALEFMPVMMQLAQIFTDPAFIGGIQNVATGIGSMLKFMSDHKDDVLIVTGALIGLRKLGPLGAIGGGIAGALLGKSLESDLTKAEKRIKEIQRLLADDSSTRGRNRRNIDTKALERELENLISIRDTILGVGKSGGGAPTPSAPPGGTVLPKMTVTAKAPPISIPSSSAGTILTEEDLPKFDTTEIDAFAAAMDDLQLRLAILRGDFAGFDAEAVNLASSIGALGEDGMTASTELTVLNDQIKQVKAWEEARAIIEETKSETAQYADEVIRLNELLPILTQLLGSQEAAQDLVAQRIAKMREQLRGAGEDSESLSDKFSDVGFTFQSAFEDAIIDGKKLSDVLKALERDLLRLLLRKFVLEKLFSFIGNFLGGLINSVGGAAAGGAGAAMGAVFDHTGRTRFAGGGIVTRPTNFMSRSGPGLMGEAGPEAIMPLRRKNGRLGVSADGLPPVNLQVIINNAPEGTSASQDGNRTEINIPEMISGMIAQPGNPVNRAIKNTFGLQQKTINR